MGDIFADTKDIYIFTYNTYITYRYILILIFPLKELKEDLLLEVKSSQS